MKKTEADDNCLLLPFPLNIKKDYSLLIFFIKNPLTIYGEKSIAIYLYLLCY